MEKIVFECESVTPIFMYGADGTTPELRPASIKGVMRFWWRTINGNKDISILKKAESEIFGSTNNKSSFSIKINNITKSVKFYKDLIEEIKEFDGIKYNFYHIFLKNEGKKYFEKLKFDLEIKFFRKQYIEEILKTLVIINFFGGFGTRNRRGAGSVSLKIKNPEILEEKIKNVKTLKEIMKLFDTSKVKNKEDLKKHIKEIFRIIPITSNTLYSTLYKKIYIFNHNSNWTDSLEMIAKPFKEFRNSKKSNSYNTPNFGIPIRHKNGSIFIGAKIKEDECKDKKQRRASPLIFKLLKINNNYFPIIIWLSGDLLPNNYYIMSNKCEKNNKDQIMYEKPNNKIINEFFGTFKSEDYVRIDYESNK